MRGEDIKTRIARVDREIEYMERLPFKGPCRESFIAGMRQAKLLMLDPTQEEEGAIINTMAKAILMGESE